MRPFRLAVSAFSGRWVRQFKSKVKNQYTYKKSGRPSCARSVSIACFSLQRNGERAKRRNIGMASWKNKTRESLFELGSSRSNYLFFFRDFLDVLFLCRL